MADQPFDAAGAWPDAAWRGVSTWTRDGDWWQPWRVRPDLLEPTMSKPLADHARIPNGVRWDAVTDADSVGLTLRCDPEGASSVDVLVDGEIHRTVPVTAGENDVRCDLPTGEHRVEIWLPHSAPCAIGRLELAPTTSRPSSARSQQFLADTVSPPTPRWTTYGSSITQCNAAESPTGTWPALVARRHGWDLTALGLGGQCHLDHALTVTVAESRSDLVSLCIGINIYGSSTYAVRTLPSAVVGFLATVRRTCPDVPIAIITPIYSPERENTRNAAGVTLGEIREILTSLTRLLQRDDRQLWLIDGLTLGIGAGTPERACRR